MSLLCRFEKRGSTISATEQRDPALSAFFGGAQTRSSQNVTADTAIKISTVYACINRKASALAMMPLHTMQELDDGGHRIAKEHRTYRQVHARPNDWQTSFEWRYMGQAHKMLRGNFYNYKKYVPGRGANQLIPLHPDRVWPFVITPEGTTYYMYDSSPTPPAGSKLYYQYFPINGEQVIFTASEVMHIRGYTDNGIVGKSVVRLMAESVGLAMATEQQGATLFTNGAQIGKVFKHPNKLDDPTFDRLKGELGQYTGVANSNKTIILEDGMSVEKISLTMEEAQFLETRKFQVEDICSFLDVPMMLIHRSGDKNQTFASAEVINQMFITYNMQPEFENWEQRLKEDLLFESEKGSYYFNFDFNAIMRGDMAAQAAYNKSRFETASWTPDDIRRNSGESPMNTPESKQTYLQSGMMPASMAGKQIKTTTDEKPKTPEVEDD